MRKKTKKLFDRPLVKNLVIYILAKKTFNLVKDWGRNPDVSINKKLLNSDRTLRRKTKKL